MILPGRPEFAATTASHGTLNFFEMLHRVSPFLTLYSRQKHPEKTKSNMQSVNNLKDMALKHPPAFNCRQLIVGKRLPVLNSSGSAASFDFYF
jgi:hypothetical protein